MDNQLIHQTLREAVQHQLNGETRAARDTYETILESNPNHADVHHLLGVLSIQEGDTQTALALIQKAIDLNGSVADYHLNLGGAHYLRENWADAAAAYSIAAQMNPGLAVAHKGNGAANQRLGNLREASVAYQHSLECDVNQAQVFLDLALVLEQLDDLSGAIAVLQQGLRLNSMTVEPHAALARLYEKTGNTKNAATAWYNVGVYHQSAHEPENALEAFKQSIRLDPEQRTASFFAAMIRGETVPAPPPGYVLTLFDQYAPRFDEHLDTLEYHVPEKLRAIVGQTVPESRHGTLRIVDLGCGTGKCGAHFRGMARHLAGVDLAPNMIVQARKTGMYDELNAADMIDYLRQRRAEPADLALAADVFIYTGELTAVFQVAYQSLADGGLFAFSVESCSGNAYELRSTGRYAHSETYIRNVADQAGFDVARMDPVTIRSQNRKPLEGHIIILRK